MQTKTGSGCGKHVIVAINPDEFQNGEKINTTTLWKGNANHSEIKLKVEGSYIVVPPSVSHSGHRYRFINQAKPLVLAKQKLDKIIPAFNCQAMGNACHRDGKVNDKNSNSMTEKDATYRDLLADTIKSIVVNLSPHYSEGQRDDIIFGLGGLLFKSNISLPCAKNLVSELCDSTEDEEKNKRIEVLEDSYFKGINGNVITGYDWLVKVLQIKSFNGDVNSAVQYVNDILKVLNDDIDDDNENENENEGKTVAQILIQLIENNTLLVFRDQYGIAHTKIRVDGHNETLAIDSKKFEYYIQKLYFDSMHGKVACKESLSSATNILLAQTLFGSREVALHLRVAWGKDGEIYYDMTDSKWNSIKITNQDWSMVQDPPVLFSRFNQKAQVIPNRDYSDNIFDNFLDMMNIYEPSHRLLTKALTISLLIPEIPHPIDITYGEKGGSKSTFCRFIKRLIDPDKIELLTIPENKAEFVQQLYHNYLAVYDNVKYLPKWFSDEACKAVTGVGNSKRGLYTNDEDIIYTYKRCLMINGINNSLTEPDALDRSILTEFARILPEQRKEEAEIEAQFEEMRPKLFAYILDILVKALQIKLTLKVGNLPRMADFAVWGEAIARAMGYKPMEFVNAYHDNIGKQNVEAIESNPLALAVEKFVYSWYKEGQEACWQSPTSKVLEKLNKVAQAYGIDTGSKQWPKAANSLTRRLRPIFSNLREGLGIHIVISRNTSGKSKNTSTIRMWKEPPPSPPSQNQAQNEDKIGGGSSERGDVIPTLQQVSPPDTVTICAQKSESGGSGDGGGSIPTLPGKEEAVCPTPPTSDYIAFDFEWSSSQAGGTNSDTQIIAAAFADSHGNGKVLHISEFPNAENPEHELLVAINQELLKYDVSIGWYSTGVAKYHEDTQEYLDGVDSDLLILHNRCLANGVDSIVDFNNAGIPYIRDQKHIDLHSVFGKPMVQTSIFKNSYRTLKLDEVSKAVLSDNVEAGKYKGLTGTDFQTFPVEEQKKYVLKDAELVMRLSRHNYGEVLDAMKAISELTGLNFEKVCKTGLSVWWAAIFDNMVSMGDCEAPIMHFNRMQHGQTELAFTGGIVLQPKKGLYDNLIVVDVASLYPSMAILHNISFDTVNCECCKENPESKISKEVTRDCRIEKEYWICRQKAGAFPKKLKVFKEERIRQKKLGNQVKQLALKILINGGYGVFGNGYFKYYDPRVAELITAYGRYTLSKMQEIATAIGFDVVYGDTDSLFLNYVNNNDNAAEAISKLQEECNKQLGIEVEHAKTYQTTIISEKKKHYVGWTGRQGTEPDIVGMEGDKNDRPKWINTVFRQTVYDILGNNNPIVNLKKAVTDLESGNVNLELLKRSNRLSKNPEEYENENDRKRKIGLTIGARKGDVIEYYESDNKEGYSLNLQEISIKKYRAMLWKAVKDILEIAGLDVAAVEQELISNCKDDHMAKPPSGVVGMHANQFAKSSS